MEQFVLHQNSFNLLKVIFAFAILVDISVLRSTSGVSVAPRYVTLLDFGMGDPSRNLT